MHALHFLDSVQQATIKRDMNAITIGLATLLATSPTPPPAQNTPDQMVVPVSGEPGSISHPTMVDLMDRASFGLALTAYGAWTGLWASHYLAGGHPAQALVPATLAGGALGAGIAYWLEPRLNLQTTMPAIGLGLEVGTFLSYLSLGATNSELNATTASTIWASGLGAAGILGAMAHNDWLRRNEMATLLSGTLIGATLGKSTLMMMSEINPFLNQSKGALAGAIAGGIAFPILARWLEISRERSAYLDLGALSGGLLGVGISLMSGFSSPTLAGAMLFGGLTVGWGSALALTSTTEQAAIAPLSWRLSPGVVPSQTSAGDIRVAPGMRFSLFW